MSIMLECRIDRDAAGTEFALPYARVERAYMLLDALRCGALREITFRSGSVLLACRCGDADVLEEKALSLSAATVSHIKAVLLQAALHPQEAEWLHADVEAAGGDVTLRIMNP